MAFVKAVKKQLKAKVLLDGSSGSGKTFSALLLAEGLGKKIAVIDTENRSASLYADRFNFDVLELSAPFESMKYVKAIKEAEEAKYEVLIIDSITHEWNGVGGCLEEADRITQISNSKNSYIAWAKVTPKHNAFINAILQSKMHIICTVRTKTGYEMGVDSQGKKVIQKVGLQPITREGFEYEMTVVFSLGQTHYAECTKDRTGLFDGRSDIITKETGKTLLQWLNSGEEEKEVIAPIQTPTPKQENATTPQKQTTTAKVEAEVKPEPSIYDKIKPLTHITTNKEIMATSGQIKALHSICGSNKFDENTVKERYKITSFTDFTKDQAIIAIESLQNIKEN